MKGCAILQSIFAAREEIWATPYVAAGRHVERREAVVCPKPRRVGLVHASVELAQPRPLRWYKSHEQEDCDLRAGNELLDIIFAKGDSGSHEQSQVASSPPFFSGSPPVRVSNPLIQDACFGDKGQSPRVVVAAGESSSSNRKGGCVVREGFGNNPALRVEGFDCLDGNRRNCSIPTMA